MCLKNINNNEKHSAKLVITIFNPLHHTRDFFASSRGPNDYFGPRQPFWKSFLNFAYFEMAKNLSKSGKRIKLKSIPSFLGDVWLIKVLSEFLFGHSKCHFFVPKSEHFCQKCPFSSPKKWHIGWPNESSETTFISQTSPKNGGIDICFEQLSLLSKILDDFKFQAIFLWARAKKVIWPVGGQIFTKTI